MLSHVEMLCRIAVGSICGGFIGYERDVHRRPIGLRTHFIVAMASATFMVISSQFVYFQHYARDDLVVVDSSRIAAAIVSAVGFLAGGAILRTGISIQGLTTAAGLWLVTAIGMCAGSGMYVEGGAVTLFGLFALTVLRRLEDKNDHLVRRRVSVVLSDDSGAVESVRAALEKVATSVSDVKYQKFRRTDGRAAQIVVAFDVALLDSVDVSKLIGAVEIGTSVRRVIVKRT